MIFLLVIINVVFARWWEFINKADQRLFLLINKSCATPWLDKACLAWREPITWLPLYIFLFIFSIWKLKKKSWIWMVALIVTVTITDQVSSTLIKNLFGRLRPCSDPLFSQYIRLVLGRCPTSGSFTSSHAANHFGIAMFIYRTLIPYLQKGRYLFFVWAALISLSQVYVGVHYPTDILGGAITGCLIAWFTSYFYLRILPSTG